jgi:hypothetical protein
MLSGALRAAVTAHSASPSSTIHRHDYLRQPRFPCRLRRHRLGCHRGHAVIGGWEAAQYVGVVLLAKPRQRPLFEPQRRDCQEGSGGRLGHDLPQGCEGVG